MSPLQNESVLEAEPFPRKKKYRSKTDFVCRYLRKHSYEALPELARRIAEESQGMARDLAAALAQETDSVLLDAPAPGYSYSLLSPSGRKVRRNGGDS